MKISQNTNKKSFLKKLLIKLCRKVGYEIIDQNNLFIPSLNKFANQNLSNLHKDSISIPLGKVKITRKIKELSIIVRTYTSTGVEKSKIMLDQNKFRIFEKQKIEYTLRTINSLIISCKKALKNFKNFKISLVITDDNSSEENLSLIKKLINSSNLNYKIISLQRDKLNEMIKKKDEYGKDISEGMISNMSNILKSILLTKDEVNDLVYFVEDDYIHDENAISEMLFAFERLTSQLGKDVFLCPADYPYLYNKIEDTKIFLGNKRHWRTVKETLITFMTSKEMILKYWEDFIAMSTIRHHPMEKKLHEIYEKEYCLSPIPSLAMHATNINSAYGIPPNYDWIKNWEDNKI